MELSSQGWTIQHSSSKLYLAPASSQIQSVLVRTPVPFFWEIYPATSDSGMDNQGSIFLPNMPTHIRVEGDPKIDGIIKLNREAEGDKRQIWSFLKPVWYGPF